jgi:hypothetical protein
MGNERLEIRSDILKIISSNEASRVTPFLSMIYLRLVRAPPQFWEQSNTLRFSEKREDSQRVTTAWAQLTALVKVSPGTARKALRWLHDQGVISYSTSNNEREIILSFEGILR